ncbi:Zinc finger, FYVE-type [Corchorus capsularis]|uniref:Zinc finger, FYVE-type n=1 Tax=Corchorus capsularis TaxID=210143 RepID=A0A1R3JEB1_COCAP|nr:Zinc finger, FYVE-type [Corchorus capsularis]
MLEKIGLPAKPSLRGNNWVVDASHCQGCSSQFTFINRKHHCRRCGGIFCGTCTQQRMVLRGQGDSPVRICEPCKKLEEAARFELRHGYKSRAGRGSLKSAAKDEDGMLNQILGADSKDSSSSGVASKNDKISSVQRAASSASGSNVQVVASHDEGGEIHRSQSVDQRMQSDVASASPEDLRQQALDEKKKFKILKGEGKSEEALKAFKRGKELERQADSLEIYIRKSRKRGLSSGNISEYQIKDPAKESGRKNKVPHQVGGDKGDLAAELRELGWSDMDLHNDDKKSASMSLEGELSSLLGEIPKKASSHGNGNTEVVAIKKKALMLKREGKLAEAKEELKRAKILEKQIEEQELLAGAEDSDDELSALIRSMDDDKQDEMLYEDTQDFDLGHLAETADDLGINSNFEVTDEDMEDPEITAALRSLGWAEDSISTEDLVAQSPPVNRDALLSEILSLKREAVSQKRAGNVAEAMAQLKKAKLLEKDLESFDSKVKNVAVVKNGSTSHASDISVKSVKLGDGIDNAMKDIDQKPSAKSRLMIQKELLGLKKKALALRREGRLDEAEEELKKGKILERQLEEMENTSNLKASQVTIGSEAKHLTNEHPDLSENLPVEGDVTDHDMHDPTYLSILGNLGWNDNEEQKDSEIILESSLTPAPPKIPSKASKRTKAELQRELLGLKRKALALRRQGNTDEAEEVLESAKALEAEIAEMEAPKKVVESKRPNEKVIIPSHKGAAQEADDENVTEKDMNDPALLSMLNNLGWEDQNLEPVTMPEKYSTNFSNESLHSGLTSVTQPSSHVSVSPPRSKGEIQRELLGLKRKALALRRNGQTEEAEELLQKAKVLEAEMAELEVSKGDVVLDSSKDSKSGNSESFISQGRQGNLKSEVKIKEGPVEVVVGPSNTVIESSIGLGRVDSATDSTTMKNSDFLEDILPSMGKLDPSGPMGRLGGQVKVETTSFIPSFDQPANIVDLLTGDDLTRSQSSTEKLDDKFNFGSDVSSLARPNVELISQEDLRTKDEATPEKSKVVDGEQMSIAFDTNSVQGFSSQNSEDSLRQAVLSHKKKALALKRDGKLAEAREELRQAKLLEKSLAADGTPPKTGANGSPESASAVHFDVAKEQGASSLAPKPVSGRDRFKLQQESLSHKRQALKLRREGRMQEAEAEFELAKSLEAQLEELAAQDSTKSSAVDDVIVEDLLDPQLLSALKAIGLDDSSVVSQRSESQGSVKSNSSKSENVDQERIQLQERIKVEKLKAVNLKRYEKKNVDAVKAIISIAIEVGNHLQEAWEHILTCLSRIEHLQLLGEGAPTDASFLSVSNTETDEKAPKSAGLQSLERKGTLNNPAVMAVVRGGSYDSTTLGVNNSGLVTPEQINSFITNLNLLEQIGNFELNHVFAHSQRLNSEAIVAFVKAQVSISELQSPTDPRVFSLTKLVEIAHYNMNRIRLVWSRMWNVFSDFFVAVGLSENLSVAIFVMDSQMVLSRVTNVKSGWKSVFMVFTAAAADERKNIVLLAFETMEKIVREYFPHITETETTTFTDCVRCLVTFTKSRFNSDVSLNAIAFLRFCAVKLAEGGACVH